MARLASKTLRNKPDLREIHAEPGRERAILEAVEEEQSRIAQELHDSVCQCLSGLRLSAAALRRKSGDLDGRAATDFAHLEEVAAKSITELHEIVQSLQPLQVSPADLAVALEEVARENRGPIECEFRPAGRPLVADVFTASQIARIAQAAVRHARAPKHVRRIVIEWHEAANECILAVKSDQPSFLECGRSADRDLGWNLLERRIAAIGAGFTVDKEGTCIKVTIPATRPA